MIQGARRGEPVVEGEIPRPWRSTCAPQSANSHTPGGARAPPSRIQVARARHLRRTCNLACHECRPLLIGCMRRRTRGPLHQALDRARAGSSIALSGRRLRVDGDLMPLCSGVRQLPWTSRKGLQCPGRECQRNATRSGRWRHDEADLRFLRAGGVRRVGRCARGGARARAVLRRSEGHRSPRRVPDGDRPWAHGGAGGSRRARAALSHELVLLARVAPGPRSLSGGAAPSRRRGAAPGRPRALPSSTSSTTSPTRVPSAASRTTAPPRRRRR